MAEAETQALPAETARMQDGACTARATQRSVSRVTLQPSVHDFNGNIINRAVDEDKMVWTMGKNHIKHTPPFTDFAYPVPAAFRRGGAFHPAHWDTSRLPFVPNGSRTDRINAWAEEVHRRHVARTARVRARLSPTKSRGGGGLGNDRVVPTAPSGISGGSLSGLYEHECSFSLSLPENGATGAGGGGGGGGDVKDLDDARFTSFSRTSSRGDNMMTSRSRPATTGRYFDSSNGLRNIRSSQTVFRSRPNTATPCSGPGLKIKKMTLHHKELVT
ncbi:uncharacterized protein LOC143297178 [Babylonia areolata]|uniref:uncharacterized protein LOC143297178 n=1 Tax=Babylonia areolata TaxID=304850 RepID=UPI003FD50FE2